MKWLARNAFLPAKIGNVEAPLCASCRYAHAMRTPTGKRRHSEVPEGEGGHGAIKGGDLKPGQRVSVDQYESRTRGRTWMSRGKTIAAAMFCGGTIFVDHASGLIHVEHQLSLGGSDTVRSARRFEQFSKHLGVKVQAYHGDNGIFNKEEFTSHLETNDQTMTFCGAGAHHQSGVAERSIRTVVWKARVMMLHAALRWPEMAKAELWPMALTHAAYLHNVTPRMDSGLAPLEIFSGMKNDSNKYPIMGRQRTWGCPAYVLEPGLRDGGKIPKWQPRSRRGMFVGLSMQHAASVGNILNVRTGTITPQFHVVYDNYFETVHAGDDKVPEVWNALTTDEREWVLDEEIFNTDHPGPTPSLGDEWLTEVDVWERNVQREERRLLAEAQRQDAKPNGSPSRCDPKLRPNQYSKHDLPMTKDLLGEFAAEAEGEPPRSEMMPRTDSTWRDGNKRRKTIGSAPGAACTDVTAVDHGAAIQNVHFAPNVTAWHPTYQPESPPRGSRRSSRRRRQPTKLNISQADTKATTYDRGSLAVSVESAMSERAFGKGTIQNAFLAYERANHDVENEEMFGDFNPVAYAMKPRNEDTPRYHEAMRGPHRDGFREAMGLEIDSLEKRQTWDLVPRSAAPLGPDGKPRVFPSTWAFKIKRYPSGLMRKLKARFCVRGDKMIEGIDYFDSYAPVVQWSTVRMMLALSVALDLKTKQVDYTNAFAQAKLKENENIFIELPVGFESPRDGDCVLRLNTSLYGSTISPVRWFEKLKAGLEARGLKQSDHDPCLFLGDKVICVIYVDDCLFFAKDNSDIDKLVESLRENEECELNYEDDVAGFLGVDITKLDDGRIKMTQIGLTKRVLELCNMENCNSKPTPAACDPLHADKDGPSRREAHLWGYSLAIGMLMYLAGHSRPELAYAVHAAARFSHNPKASHEEAVKRICRYLKGTLESGLILKPTADFSLDCYVDADFAGLYGYEDSADPISVKSRTGYVMLFCGCPIVWTSKMQSTIALSTVQAEYTALSSAMREMIPLRSTAKEILANLDKKYAGATISSTVFEDNNGCISMAKAQKITQRNKHF